MHIWHITIYLHTCTHTYIYIHIHIYTYIFRTIYICIHRYLHTHAILPYTYVFIHTYQRIYHILPHTYQRTYDILPHAYILPYTCIHTHIQGISDHRSMQLGLTCPFTTSIFTYIQQHAHIYTRTHAWRHIPYNIYIRIRAYWCTYINVLMICHHIHTIPSSYRLRGGGLGSSTIFKNLMSPTPRRKWYLTTGRRAH